MFCDELHMLVGAGKTEGSMDAANMLKPALARGEMKFVGATTLNEYRKYIESDGALARRFQTVYVSEPTVTDTISILRGIKHKYEIHHGVKILDNAVISAATYANRYLTERKLPDSAIDLIDEACSHLRMAQESSPEEIEQLNRLIITLQIEQEALKRESDKQSRDRLDKINSELNELQDKLGQLTEKWEIEKKQRKSAQSLKEELDRAYKQLEDAQLAGEFEKAGQLKYNTIPNLEKNIDKINTDSGMVPDAVTDMDVARVISRTTGISMSKLLVTDREKLLNIDKELKKSVIGQDSAVNNVSDAIRIASAGLHAHKKPIGVFMFLGPSGVGKTQLAKSLAKFMFNDENAMIRVDMSEYMERHSVSRLIGSPPGYIGYDEGGILTEAVRRRPYQVVLMDEIEKAHREVTNILLQVMDEGFLTDSHGRRVDFRNTVVIMTSNLGTQIVQGSAPTSTPAEEEEAREEEKRAHLNAVRSYFPPEFTNRIDDIIVFNRLGMDNMRPICDIQINDIDEMLHERNIDIFVTDAARDYLGQIGFSEAYGARPLKRVIQSHMLKPLSVHILSNDIIEGSKVEVDYDMDKDGLSFSWVNPPKDESNENKESDLKYLDIEHELSGDSK